MFAFEHYGIVPDMVVLGKGLGGAVFPMAALIARRDLDIAADRALGHYTHEKSSVGCAAALATLEVIEDERLLERSRDAGRARAGAHARPASAAIRSSATSAASACCSAIELARDGVPARREAEQVMYHCLARGLSFKVGQGNVLALSPPLGHRGTDLERAFEILEQAISRSGVMLIGVSRTSTSLDHGSAPILAGAGARHRRRRSGACPGNRHRRRPVHRGRGLHRAVDRHSGQAARPELDVVVLEADTCGAGASGRNGGCVLTWSTKFFTLRRLFGEAEALRLVRASEKP